MQRYQVVAALVLATTDKKADGTGGMVHYVYQDGLVPLGAVQDVLDGWVKQGLVAPVDSGPVVPPNVEQLQAHFAALGVIVSAEQAEAILAEQAPAEGEDGEGEAASKVTAPLPPGAPGRSAKKDRWEAFAVTLGMDEEAAKAATKDELIARAEALVVQG